MILENKVSLQLSLLSMPGCVWAWGDAKCVRRENGRESCILFNIHISLSLMLLYAGCCFSQCHPLVPNVYALSCVCVRTLLFVLLYNCISFVVQLLFLTASVGIDHQLPHNIFSRCKRKFSFSSWLLLIRLQQQQQHTDCLDFQCGCTLK